MKARIKIEGIIDEEKGKLELNKSGLSVPHLVMTVTALTKMLFNDMDEEDHDAMRKLLKEIAEDPEEELKRKGVVQNGHPNSITSLSIKY